MRPAARRLTTLLTLALLATANAQTSQALAWIDQQQDTMLEFFQFANETTSRYSPFNPTEPLNYAKLGTVSRARAAEIQEHFDELAADYDTIAEPLRTSAASNKDMALYKALSAGFSSLLSAYNYLTGLASPDGLTYQQQRAIREDIDQWSDLRDVWLMLYRTL